MLRNGTGGEAVPGKQEKPRAGARGLLAFTKVAVGNALVRLPAQEGRYIQIGVVELVGEQVTSRGGTAHRLGRCLRTHRLGRRTRRGTRFGTRRLRLGAAAEQGQTLAQRALGLLFRLGLLHRLPAQAFGFLGQPLLMTHHGRTGVVLNGLRPHTRQ